VCGDAENGKEAVEKAQKLHPDLIVLDLSMPVMNGLGAACVLKRLMPSVPLIMYSAFGDKSMEHQAQLIGISEVVSKSENASVLIRKARGLLYPTAAWPNHSVAHTYLQISSEATPTVVVWAGNEMLLPSTRGVKFAAAGGDYDNEGEARAGHR
jgi:DNA-binding NarL/FixJ family response regulator